MQGTHATSVAREIAELSKVNVGEAGNACADRRAYRSLPKPDGWATSPVSVFEVNPLPHKIAA